jgi:hypothetical protein
LEDSTLRDASAASTCSNATEGSYRGEDHLISQAPVPDIDAETLMSILHTAREVQILQGADDDDGSTISTIEDVLESVLKTMSVSQMNADIERTEELKRQLFKTLQVGMHLQVSVLYKALFNRLPTQNELASYSALAAQATVNTHGIDLDRVPMMGKCGEQVKKIRRLQETLENGYKEDV